MKNNLKRSPYLINIFWSDEDRLYIAEVPELEGCLSHGKTPTDAARHAEDAIASWVQTAKKMGHPIPLPVVKRKISGKFNVRLPKQIHKDLIIRAAREGVSLNHMVSTLLSHSL